MKRIASLAPLLFAVVGLAACDKGTFVILDFSSGPANATSIDCALSLSGKTATATFSDKGKALSFPIEGSLEIASGSGTMSVKCEAKGASGTLGTVDGIVDVLRDKTETLTLLFEAVGPDMSANGDAMHEDGGTDGSADMEITPTMLGASPLAHDYGTVNTMTTSPTFTFTITNNGTTPTGALEVGIDNPLFTVQSGTCQGVELSAGATCFVGVAYTPTTAVMTTGTLTVTYAGLPIGDAATAGLSGNGALAGALSWSDSTATFDDTVVGTMGNTKTFTLSNTSTTVTTTDVTISLTGSDTTGFMITDDECTNVALAPSGTCTVTVQFTPDMTGEAQPILQATATTGGTATVMLMGDGLAAASLSSTSPVDFGVVDITNASTMMTITVSNSGDVATGLLSYTATGVTIVTGTNGGTCAASGTAALAAHGNCTLVTTMTPATYGAHTGSVAFSATPGGTATTDTTVTGQDYVTVMAAQVGTILVGGSGTVTDDSMMIDCSSTATMCEAVFPRTTDLTVTLTEVPDSGSSFTTWTTANGPDCTGGDTMTTCAITFGSTYTGSAMNVKATTPPTYTAHFTSP